MQTLSYPTGRTYDKPQVLRITIESQSAPDDFGIYDIVATFNDDARCISGRVNLTTFDSDPRSIGSAVLSKYDAGTYSPL